MSNNLQSFFEGYFFGFFILISIAVGALGVRIIHTITGGSWGELLKKYYLSASRTIGFAFLLWLPIIFWLARLYPWASPQKSMALALFPAKAVLLSGPFFIIRSLVYFCVWIGITYWLDHYNKRFNISGLLAVVYFLNGTFACFDWVMSLEPLWYSTIFAAMFVIGQILFGYCVLLVSRALDKKRDISAKEEGFIDQGSLLLTFVMLWAYLAFSQFLIIWMGNLPDEISWYLARIRNGWAIPAVLIIVVHFFIPFFLLLNRAWKKSTAFLGGVALLLIFMRVVDLAWMIFPGLSRQIRDLTVMHAAAAILSAGIYCLILYKINLGYAHAAE